MWIFSSRFVARNIFHQQPPLCLTCDLKKISNLINSDDETYLSHTPITKKVGKMFSEKEVCDKKVRKLGWWNNKNFVLHSLNENDWSNQWPGYLIFFVVSLATCLAGSQVVHLYYRPNLVRLFCCLCFMIHEHRRSWLDELLFDLSTFQRGFLHNFCNSKTKLVW